MAAGSKASAGTVSGAAPATQPPWWLPLVLGTVLMVSMFLVLLVHGMMGYGAGKGRCSPWCVFCADGEHGEAEPCITG